MKETDPCVSKMLLAGLILSAAGLALADVAGRRQEDLNWGWTYSDGTGSRLVDLPHDFQLEMPWKKTASPGRGFKEMGEGRYEKSFVADPAWKSRRVSLDFGGIQCLGEVFLNGACVAREDFGYLGFEVPVGDKLRYGQTNVVVVKASTGRTDGSRWYTGGGLYRGVRLIVRDKVSVARHGVFVTTPVVEEHTAEVRVQVDVDGWMRRTNDLSVAVRVFGPDGDCVGAARASGPKDVRTQRVTLDLPPINVARPKLWSVDGPNLYSAEVTVRVDGEVRDRVVRRFGIRKIEFGPDFGFRLNGKKVFLKGMCNHHDLGALGAAAYPRAIERQFRMMKEFGFNAIRCSHNPYSEEFYDLADEMGLLVVDELTDKWSGDVCTVGRPMTDRFFPLISEWVRHDRNHPSVILWSLGNELQQSERFSGFPSDDEGVTTYRIFDTVVKRWDPTRPTTVALYPARAGGYARKDGARFFGDKTPPPLAGVTDVASFNYVWYDFPDYQKVYPDMTIFQSEATVLDCLLPYWGMNRERTVGLAYWGAIAYWGESNGWPAKGWFYSFFGHDLRPAPTAYLMRTAFRPDVPQVHLAVDEGVQARMWNDVRVGRRKFSSSWNRAEGKRLDLTAFTNAETVELLLNGRTLGIRTNDCSRPETANIVAWKDVAWKAGRLEAVARRGGKEVARHGLETVGETDRFELVDETPGWTADGRDLKFVRIQAVDERNRHVCTAAKEVAVSVDGDARLLALDDGDHDTDRLFGNATRCLREGSLLAIMRAGRTPGDVRLTVRCKGIANAVRTYRMSAVDENRSQEGMGPADLFVDWR